MAGTRVDLHVKVIDDAVVRRAKARGIAVLVYAPHFTRWPDIRETARRYSDDDLLVVPAREVFTGSWRNRKHVLALDLEAPVPDFLSLSGTMAALDRQDAVVLVPHPGFLTVSLDAGDVDTYREQLAAIETYNPKHLPHHNRRAREIADRFDLPRFASSYAHLRGSVGEAWTDVDADVAAVDDLHEALRDGVTTEPGRRRGAGHQWRSRVEFAHLGWENSVTKARRVLGGLEPTHPAHPAYDGRFGDEAVY